jgi:hypothetical protein
VIFGFRFGCQGARWEEGREGGRGRRAEGLLRLVSLIPLQLAARDSGSRGGRHVVAAEVPLVPPLEGGARGKRLTDDDDKLAR